MDSEELCRKCRFPAKDYATNMTYDKYGEWIRCSRCVEMKRKVDQQRTEWNQRVVFFVKKLDPELQDYYRYDLEHGTLRNYLLTMRESGKSPADAVRAWRHKVMYIDATQGRKTTKRHRSNSQFQAKYEAVPQRQYRPPSEMPLVFSPPMDVIEQTPLPVIFAPPTQVVMTSNGLQRMYFPSSESSSDSDDCSDTSSESSSSSFRGQVSGIVKDRHGRMAVVVTDSRGRKARGRSILAYFAT